MHGNLGARWEYKHMPLDNTLKLSLKRRGHGLKPIVILGTAGLTPAVCQEIDKALTYHELIKIRVNALHRAHRGTLIADVCNMTGAQLIQAIGHIALIYRPRPASEDSSL